jgi:nucleoid DNA-binding protein
MNKNELIETIAANTGSSKAQAARTITALTEIITEQREKVSEHWSRFRFTHRIAATISVSHLP